eukprot:Nk52_evm56s1444 gene=Nk52_evmTU56s1444
MVKDYMYEEGIEDANDGVRAFPEKRQEDMKWNGWGYKDSKFEVDEEGEVCLTGSRYSMSGMTMPTLRQWMVDACGLDLDDYSPAKEGLPETPKPNLQPQFWEELRGVLKTVSLEPEDRIVHSHGHTCYEIFNLRNGIIGKIPDAVVWPANHKECEALVLLASKYNICLIPFGGGTGVSGGVSIPEKETRMVVSVDMTNMCRILWVDPKNMTARVECGIVGQDLERRLSKFGFCTGHEPDSMEFSSLGGWIATRASGMKKSIYGNIEDIVVSCSLVSPKGTVEKPCVAPRVSLGPDVQQIVLGSEGTLGLITEATLKIRKLPKCRAYGSIVFPNFEAGVQCLNRMTREGCKLASVRLVDNDQFRFGLALKPKASSAFKSFADKLKKLYVTKYKGFKPDELCVATLMFEGDEYEVDMMQKKVYDIADKFNGLPGGEENGKRGYFLTFMIAYLRDIGFDYHFIAESFETSVPWAHVLNLCRNTKDTIHRKCDELGVGGRLVSCRVTQTYDTGVCVYFYFGFVYKNLKDPLDAYHQIEVAARDEVLANGGSLSHHHGIGKLRSQWMKESITETGVNVLKAIKENLDPENIFGNGNLIENSHL